MAKRMKHDEAPEITAAQFAKMRPMKEAAPGLVEAHKALRGRPKVEYPKQVISVRLSPPAKRAWDELPTEKRAKLVKAMERGAILAAK